MSKCFWFYGIFSVFDAEPEHIFSMSTMQSIQSAIPLSMTLLERAYALNATEQQKKISKFYAKCRVVILQLRPFI